MEGNKRIAIGVIVVIVFTIIVLNTVPEDTNPFRDIRWVGFNNQNDSVLFTAAGSEFTKWDLESETTLQSRDLGSRINEFDISSNGECAIGTDSGKMIFLDIETFEITNTFYLPSGVSTVDWSENSSRFAAGLWDGTFIVWENGTQILNTSLANEWVYAIALSYDGSYLAICYRYAGLYVFNITEPDVPVLHINSRATDCAFSPSGDLAAAFRNGDVFVYEKGFWTPYFSDEILGLYHVVDWSRDGNYLYASGGEQAVRVWSLPNGNIVSDRTFRREYVRSMDESNGTVAVAIHRYVYIFDGEGEFVKFFPSQPNAPLLLPISMIGFVALTILIILAEMERRKTVKNTQAFFAERRIPSDEKILLGLLATYFSIVIMVQLAVWVDILFAAIWYALFMGLFFGTMIIFMILPQPNPLVIDSQGISLSTSIYQSVFKKKPRRVNLSYVSKIKNKHFYNRLEKDMKHMGFKVILMDGGVGDINLISTQAPKTDDVKEALAKAFGSRWSTVYIDEPYVDTERWEKIGYLAKKNFKLISITFGISIMIPMFLLMFLTMFFISYIIDIFYLILIVFMAAISITMVWGMRLLMNYHEAVSIKASMELMEHKKGTPSKYVPDELKVEPTITPDKHLAMSEVEWRKIERLLARERPLLYLMFPLMAVFFVSLLLGGTNDIPILMVPAMASFGMLMGMVFYSSKFQQGRTLVKKAVDHELKTGEIILPEDFKIPSGWFSNISRGPIEIAEKELATARKITDQGEMWLTKHMILLVVILLISMFSVMTMRPFMDQWYGPLIFAVLILGPIFPLMFYVTAKQRIVNKVKYAEEIDKMLKERVEGD